ncbi:MAG: acyl-carrier-protein S-malonyltransferase [Candidatus Brocadia sinica]|uniref:Malonyl CoA-acyl carrier protein transacylase n=1 Tax=Candidatus Brocadia sinica JPN1 TaxID=1197129 RepID=A0ABQ0JUU6_9BACT|nr:MULTISPECIES: ACP S-malonyltransferase [Brocadia]KXK31789.1 MAG: acyl-carrier-protein S-malonyltransferase [Candidatus Brocadia sinica]MCK6467503.1 ACP S-malonyltransferase [Candidatus Brocadia sinica]GAN32473.1 malonyl-CoA acyl carrier protein transacylase [Candidatus Brocadia sinica JPN1]GIK13986.1 MAG: malonyl CoA-acyl carrier protein transacylase [Candidatus Brocadia sinica]GJQ18572.1 MAG: malonyl CoA-acyl carrier protein transacylase [Candidatus Brocadia sinica]
MGIFGHSVVESMRKIVLLFPGQGTQYVGMGKDFYTQFKEAQEIFNQANEILGFDIAELCFHGKQEELNKTSACQPAILVNSLAILEVLKRNSAIQGNTYLAAAGLSLGEYTAHVSAGSMAFRDAVRLVYKRGMFMQEACNANPGGMVSIIGLEDEKVEQICAEVRPLGVICAANYNSPGQVVISGEKPLLEKASVLARERGARMVVPLKVDGAFHSDLMSPASDKLAKELEATPISKPNVPVVANIHAQYVREPDEIKASLAKQLNSPVRWHQSISMLIQNGCNQFYEIGPGKTLSGLMKRIDSTQEIKNIDTVEAFENMIKLN